jgi:hypothetical protein
MGIEKVNINSESNIFDPESLTKDSLNSASMDEEDLLLDSNIEGGLLLDLNINKDKFEKNINDGDEEIILPEKEGMGNRKLRKYGYLDINRAVSGMKADKNRKRQSFDQPYEKGKDPVEYSIRKEKNRAGDRKAA